jgi:hypothetical protein
MDFENFSEVWFTYSEKEKQAKETPLIVAC